MAIDWIPIKDRLPEEDGKYLIHAPSADKEKPLIALAWYDPKGFGWSGIVAVWLKNITHWAAVDPPKEVEP